MAVQRTRKDTEIRVPWREFGNFERTFVASLSRLKLHQSRELAFSVGFSSGALHLGVSNADRGNARGVGGAQANGTTQTSATYAEQGVQCELDALTGPPTTSNDGFVGGSILFHPYQLKRGRQIKCIQVGQSAFARL
ncbi:hypothetical protein AAVH_10471 [Aphelenchoides avenae]|nr:hypothetical protein AAVH_10471 [Aphelenchus avenae]